jgi:hypothetical protein
VSEIGNYTMQRNIVTCAAWLAIAESVMEAQSSSSTESEDRSRCSMVAMIRSRSRCGQILPKLGASKSGSRKWKHFRVPG